MRSSVPIPGNPWPHDMVITIEDGSDALLTLLWIREAWRLDVAGDELPPPLTDSPAPVEAEDEADETDASTRAVWTDAWPGLWRDCLAHAATGRDPQAIARLHELRPGSPELQAALHELRGPAWQDRFGSDALRYGYAEWSRTIREGFHPPGSSASSPEREALDALVPAWRAGLTTVVQLPCRGPFALTVAPHGLVVTAETRADPERYRAALQAFRP